MKTRPHQQLRSGLFSVIVLFFIFAIQTLNSQTTETFTSSTTWTAPPGVTSVTVECWGGGASGSSSNNNSAGGGGGGGAYSRSLNIVVVPGNTYTVTVGLGGAIPIKNAAGNPGGDTWFLSTGTVLAKGGNNGTAPGAGGTGGLGGDAALGIGNDATYSGGNGADGAATGGGGGSSAGTNADGGNGGSPTGGTAPSGGGDGGDGANNNDGNPGSPPGGAGGGSEGKNNQGGAGANGQVKLTYTISNDNCPESTSIAPTGTQTLCEGDTATQLTATITNSGGDGTPTHLYQWYYNTTNSNTVSGATLIAGATSQTYTPLTTASEIGDRWYFCVGYATNNNCNQTNADQSLASNAVQVTINEQPTTSNAGGPQTICDDGSSATLGSNTPTVGTGLWSVTSGPSTSSAQFANTADPGTTFTPAGGAGSYVLTWTISNAPCTPSSSNVTITVNEQPTTSNAGGPQTICDGSGATLGANSPTAGTGAWSIVSGPSTNLSQFSSTTDPGATFTPDGGVGDYVLRWTISNAPCTPSTSDVTITVITTPATPGAISGPVTVTPNTSGLIYSISPVTYATTYNWTVPTGWTITAGNGTISITVTSGNAGQNGNITVTAQNICGTSAASILAVTSENNNCPASTSIAPTGIQNHCEGDSATQLTATITNSGGDGTPTHLYQWYYNTSNSNTVSGATLIGGATSQTYTPLTTASEIGDRWYFCVGYATDNNCSQTNADQTLASNTVQVSVSGTPTTASAGSPQTICNDGSSATLGANSPTVGTGLWSVTSGPSTSSAQFANTSDPGTTFTPAGGAGSYVLTWTISNAPCTPSSSNVTITVNEQPTTSNAGGPQTICDGSGATLGANSPSVGTGAWSIISGPSTNLSQFSSTTDPGATFTPDAGVGDYVLRWTISNAPCTPSTSDVTITVKDVPALPVISGPSTITPGNPETYSITPVADALNYTWTVPVDWTINSGQDSPSINVTPQSAGDVTVYVTNSCGDGPTATKSVTIGVSANCPESTNIAPSDPQSLCVGDASNQLTVTVTDSGGSGTPTHLYQWYYNSSNSNTVSGATLISGATSQTYTPPTTVAGDRWYFCVGYATDNGCGQTNNDQSLASNTVQVTVYTLPIAAAITGANEVCIGSDITLTAGTSGTIAWNSSDTGVATINPSGLVTGLSTGTTDITYTVTDVNGCTSLPSPVHVVNVIDTPVTPNISGISSVPPFAAGYQYSITADPTATLYSWNFPPNWVITSDPNSNVVIVITGGIDDDGDITVTVTNPCGTSPQDTFTVAVDPATNHTLYNCTSCHITHSAPGNNLTNATGNALLCQSCHQTTGAAGAKPLANADKGTSSHNWNVPAVNGTMETELPLNTQMSLRVPDGNIICSTCHNQHNNGNAGNPYLRMDNAGDAMCKDCHRPRDRGLYADDNTNNKGTHPVGITYDGGDSRFNASPSNTQLVSGNVECSSCHGVHDVTGSLGLAANGNLLRTTNDVNLCTDCHNYESHQGMDCLDCHQVHNTNKTNIYMIKNSILTPNSGTKTVVFSTQTGANSFADGDGTYDGVCEVCHTGTSYFRNDGSAPDQNHVAQGGPMSGDNCTICHPHSTNFAPSGGGCTSCHEAEAPTFTSTVHVKHKDTYGFTCSTCHFNYGSGGSLEGGTHPSETININFDPNGLATRNGQDGNTPTWTSGTKTCSNIYCHSDGRSAYRGTDGTYTWSNTTGSQTAAYTTTPTWSTGTITSCDACHSGTGNMTEPYTITTPGLADPLPPDNGAHRRGAHTSNSQENDTNGWDAVQCFWCHNTVNGDDGSPILQGTYGSSFHVDGTTYFDPRSVVDGGTLLNNPSGGSFSYSYSGSSAHCGNGKTCW